MEVLKIGEKLLLSDGVEAVVENSYLEHAKPGQSFTTYNFEVEEWHTYFVRPANTEIEYTWVHNLGDGICSKGMDRVRKYYARNGPSVLPIIMQTSISSKQYATLFMAANQYGHGVIPVTLANMGEATLLRRTKGGDTLIPPDWQIHHMKNIQYGGTNAFENLIPLRDYGFHHHPDIMKIIHDDIEVTPGLIEWFKSEGMYSGFMDKISD